MTYDVVVIGGGVMGLFTALRFAENGADVAVLEKNRIGYEKAASSGLTRSFRCDYTDPLYRSMAQEARALWQTYQLVWGREVLNPCGLVNLASYAVTPDLTKSYAWDVGAGITAPDAFVCDFASGDDEAGVLCPKLVRESLVSELQKRKVPIFESVAIRAIRKYESDYNIETYDNAIPARKVVIAAGMWSNDLLRKVDGFSEVDFSITTDSPNEVLYFSIPETLQYKYAAPALPVFACLDMGVYGHPIIPGYVPYVKISHYIPPEQPDRAVAESRIREFCKLFMPELLNFATMPVTGSDQCLYDYTPDRDFILGPLNDDGTLLIATGWNGTGFKFAPLIAEYLSGGKPIPERFLPQRFLK